MRAIRLGLIPAFLVASLAAGAAQAALTMPEPELPAAPTVRMAPPPSSETALPTERPMLPLSEALRPTLTQPASAAPEVETRLRLPPGGVAGLELGIGLVKPMTWEAEAMRPPRQRKPWSEKALGKLSNLPNAGWTTTLFIGLCLALVGGLILRARRQRVEWREREFERHFEPI